MATSWTDDRVEKLKKLHNDGYSCSLIASRLGGGATRNSVIGKLHRLGLARGGQMPKVRQPVGRRYNKLRKPFNTSYRRDPIDAASVKAAKAELEATLSAPEVHVPLNERKGLLDLEPGDCRWPIGDPIEPDFHFCNGKATPGLPYCRRHCLRAYQTPAVRAQAEGRRNSEASRAAAKLAAATHFNGNAAVSARLYNVDTRSLDIHEKEPA